MGSLIQTNNVALSSAGTEIAVHARVLRFKEQTRPQSQNMCRPDIDHTAVAKHHDRLTRMRRNDLLQCVNDTCVKLMQVNVYSCLLYTSDAADE